MPAPRKFSDEMRERAKRMVREAREQEPGLSVNAACKRIGPQLGIVPGHPAGVVQAGRHRRRPGPGDHDRGVRGAQAAAPGERRAAAGERDPEDGVGVFRGGGARPPYPLIVDYIDQHKDRFGVEPICAALRAEGIAVAPSGYYAAQAAPARRGGRFATRRWRRSSRPRSGTGTRAAGSTGPARCAPSCAATASPARTGRRWRAAPWSGSCARWGCAGSAAAGR